MNINNLFIYQILLIGFILITIYMLLKNNNSINNLPDIDDLLKSESLSKKEGSSIDIENLSGNWKFIYVWGSGTNKKNSFASYFLRFFRATLKLEEKENFKECKKYNIFNSIKFGELLLSFIGSAEIKGRQPILAFFFERIELRLGERVLINRILEIPEAKNMPFFALIALNKKDRWLSARGRGGGLALWSKD